MPQYMQQNEPGSTVGVGQSSSQYYSTQPEQPSYGSISYARPQLQPPFAPSSTEYSMLEQPLAPQAQEEANTRQATEEGRRQYEQQLRATFDAIIAGRVTEASEKLIVVTEWLLGSVRALGQLPSHEHHRYTDILTGLHHDDEENHDQRIVLWRELNHAWEALGQKQKSITETALRTQQSPPDYLTSTAMQNLMDKLTQLCDSLEKYGLVDYEIGIWEEQIVSIFVQCLDILPHDPAEGGSGIAEG